MCTNNKDFEAIIDEMRENKRLIEALTAENDRLKSEVIAFMGDLETFESGSARATYKTVEQTRLDSAALKKAAPRPFREIQQKDSIQAF